MCKIFNFDVLYCILKRLENFLFFVVARNIKRNIGPKWINPFIPITSFLYPLKTAENLRVFLCFQGVEKRCIGNKWIKLYFRFIGLLVPLWSGYHCCTTSFNKAGSQVLHRLKSCSWHAGYWRWWESLPMFPAGNKENAFRRSAAKSTHHHHSINLSCN